MVHAEHRKVAQLLLSHVALVCDRERERTALEVVRPLRVLLRRGVPGLRSLPAWMLPLPDDAKSLVHASSVVTFPAAGSDTNVLAGGGYARWLCCGVAHR